MPFSPHTVKAEIVAQSWFWRHRTGFCGGFCPASALFWPWYSTSGCSGSYRCRKIAVYTVTAWQKRQTVRFFVIPASSTAKKILDNLPHSSSSLNRRRRWKRNRGFTAAITRSRIRCFITRYVFHHPGITHGAIVGQKALFCSVPSKADLGSASGLTAAKQGYLP